MEVALELTACCCILAVIIICCAVVCGVMYFREWLDNKKWE